MNPLSQLCFIDISRNPKNIDNVLISHNKIISGIKLLNELPNERESKLECIVLTIPDDSKIEFKNIYEEEIESDNILLSSSATAKAGEKSL